MKQTLSSNKLVEDYYIDDEYSNEEESSNNDLDDTEEDDLEEQDELNNNDNSFDELNKSDLISKFQASKANRTKKRKLSSNKSDYLNCKKRKCRTTFNKYQLNILEHEFLQSNFVSNEKIDYLIQSTGLDSRIIKNWFKNKRSRVMADTKLNSNSLSRQVPIIPIQQKVVQNSFSEPKVRQENFEDIKIQKNFCVAPNSNGNNSSNKNLNGLFNMVQSIGTDTKQIDKVKDIKKVEIDTNCSKCSRQICNCNISNQALRRLYKYCIGFNAPLVDFLNSYDEKYFFYYEHHNNDENGKVFFVL